MLQDVRQLVDPHAVMAVQVVLDVGTLVLRLVEKFVKLDVLLALAIVRQFALADVMDRADKAVEHAQLLVEKIVQEVVVERVRLVVHQHAALDVFLPVKQAAH